MKTSKLSHSQNEITTINLLRLRAAEFLSVAANLEATQRFVGNGIANVIRGSGTRPKRHMSLVARKKISKAAKARAATRRKDIAVVGKAA